MFVIDLHRPTKFLEAARYVRERLVHFETDPRMRRIDLKSFASRSGLQRRDANPNHREESLYPHAFEIRVAR